MAIPGRGARRPDWRARRFTGMANCRRGCITGSPLQDLWVGLQLGRYVRLEVGQQKPGLSEEGSRDNAHLLTIARSIMNEDLPANAGRIGNIRDTGAVLKFRASRLKGSFGIW